jgi:hypothetical protein
MRRTDEHCRSCRLDSTVDDFPKHGFEHSGAAHQVCVVPMGVGRFDEA